MLRLVIVSESSELVEFGDFEKCSGWVVMGKGGKRGRTRVDFRREKGGELIWEFTREGGRTCTNNIRQASTALT